MVPYYLKKKFNYYYIYQGLIGLEGPHGEPGVPGCNGTNGCDGKMGIPGFSGRRGPPGAFGEQGIQGMDDFHDFFLFAKLQISRKNVTIFKGDAGDGGINSPGIKGSRGVDGRPGNKVFNKISVKSISRKFL